MAAAAFARKLKDRYSPPRVAWVEDAAIRHLAGRWCELTVNLSTGRFSTDVKAARQIRHLSNGAGKKNKDVGVAAVFEVLQFYECRYLTHVRYCNQAERDEPVEFDLQSEPWTRGLDPGPLMFLGGWANSVLSKFEKKRGQQLGETAWGKLWKPQWPGAELRCPRCDHPRFSTTQSDLAPCIKCGHDVHTGLPLDCVRQRAAVRSNRQTFVTLCLGSVGVVAAIWIAYFAFSIPFSVSLGSTVAFAALSLVSFLRARAVGATLRAMNHDLAAQQQELRFRNRLEENQRAVAEALKSM
jgi:uncharacterized protein (DUF983 family)